MFGYLAKLVAKARLVIEKKTNNNNNELGKKRKNSVCENDQFADSPSESRTGLAFGG